MSDRPWKYYQYKCLPSSELRGKRKEHEEGYCGRPILRKSKESLPIQGSPCPHCSRRTRVNELNLLYDKSYDSIEYDRRTYLEHRTERREEFVLDKRASEDFHKKNLHTWRIEQNQANKSIFSNVSEETVEKIEQFAESFEEFAESFEEFVKEEEE